MNIILLLIKISWLSLSLPIEKAEVPSNHAHTPFSLDYIYLIQQVILDSVDYSEHYREVNAFLKFYRPESTDTIYMANVMEKEDTQSFGKITDLKINKEFIDGELVDVANFNCVLTNSKN